MKVLMNGIVQAVGTLLRFVPFPCRPGLAKVGNPQKDSPVFLTGNYHLTVRRVKKELQGQDAFLLAANSRGINVWCAAAGGHLTHHDVISALKTNGMENLVSHRTVILPQLAACGIDARVVQKKSGWRVVWGPVYAEDIPAFVQSNMQKTNAHREVRFPVKQRLEMAVAWAFPMSVVFSLVLLLFRRENILPLNGLIWSLSLLMFVSFPFFQGFLGRKNKSQAGRKLGKKPDKNLDAFIVFWLFLAMAGMVVYGLLKPIFSWDFYLFWGIASGVLVLTLGIDMPGSTPFLLSGFREENSLEVVLEKEACRGAGFCDTVCPRHCYLLETPSRKATLHRPDKCVRCGACIIQCPFDAIHFVDEQGRRIPPDHTRQHRVSLLGKRKRTS